MGLFSSKPEWVEWHPDKPFNEIKRDVYNEKTNDIRSGVTWDAGWEFSNYSNLLYAIDQIKILSDKMDKILIQNDSLQKKCEYLEQEIKILKR